MSDPGDRAFKLRLAEVAQRPIIDNAVPVSQRNPRVHQEHLEWIAKAQSEGLRTFGQGATMRAGFAFALDNWNLYDASPAWREATTGTTEEKISKLKDPAIRARLKDETEAAATQCALTQLAVGGPPRKLVVQGVARRQDMQQYVGKSLERIAEEENKHYIDVMLDLSLITDLLGARETRHDLRLLRRDRTLFAGCWTVGQKASKMHDMIESRDQPICRSPRMCGSNHR